MGQDGAKMAQDGTKTGQDGAKMGQDEAKMAHVGARLESKLRLEASLEGQVESKWGLQKTR